MVRSPRRGILTPPVSLRGPRCHSEVRRGISPTARAPSPTPIRHRSTAPCHSEVPRGISPSGRAPSPTPIRNQTTPPAHAVIPRSPEESRLPSNPPPMHSHPWSARPKPATAPSPSVIPRSPEESRLPVVRHRQLRSDTRPPAPRLSFRGPPRNLDFRATHPRCTPSRGQPVQSQPQHPPRCHPEVPRGIPPSARAPSPTPIRHQTTRAPVVIPRSPEESRLPSNPPPMRP